MASLFYSLQSLLNNSLPSPAAQTNPFGWKSCPEFASYCPPSSSVNAEVASSSSSAVSSSSDSSSSSSSHFFLDDCPALVDQVPTSFDLGLIPVRLCSLAASANWLAIGSCCGALFLFNRRLGQSISPLRTSYSEVLTQLQFCPASDASGDGRDRLAIGHQSGQLVLLALPMPECPRLGQHVQEDAHRGHALTALGWAPDGDILFSGDASGMLLAVHGDFANDQFPVDFVASESAPISAIAVSRQRLAFASGGQFKLVDWRSADFPLLAQFSVAADSSLIGPSVLGLAFDQESHLRLLTSDGRLLGLWAEAEGKTEAEQLGNVWASLSAEQQSRWRGHAAAGNDDQQDAKAVAVGRGESLAVWKPGQGKLLLCTLLPAGDTGSSRGFGLEVLGLDDRVGDPDLQILSVCAADPAELFVLAHPRRVLRLGRHSAAPSSLTNVPAAGGGGPTLPTAVFGSLLAAGKRRAQGLMSAAGGTDQLLGRFNRELDAFLMGGDGSGEGNSKRRPSIGTAFLPPLPEPERLAQGLHQMLGQIRQSSSVLSAEFDHWSLAGTRRDFHFGPLADRSDNRSLPTELSPSVDEDREELLSLLGDDNGTKSLELKEEAQQVRVRRRRRILRGGRRRPAIEGGGGLLRALAEERASRTSALNVEEEEEQGEYMASLEPITGEREQRLMNVLSRIMRNGPEGEQELEQQQQQVEEDTTGGTQMEEEEEEEQEDGSDNNHLENGLSGGFGRWRVGSPPPSGTGEQLFDGKEAEEDDAQFRADFGADDESNESANKNHSVTCLELSDLLANQPPPASTAFPAPSPPFDSASVCSSLLAPFRPSGLFQSVCRVPNADRWTRLVTPFAAGHLGVSRHFIVLCPKRPRAHRIHFLMTGSLAHPNSQATPVWTPVRMHADAIVPNEPGTRLWRLSNGMAYSPAVAPDPLAPSQTLGRCQDWCEMSSPSEGQVLQAALTSRHCWYLTDRGVFLQMQLPECGIGIWYRLEQQNEEAGAQQFIQIAASDHAVWALNSLGMVSARTGLRHAPMGADWADMDGQPRKFVAIALFERTGFGVDRQGGLWFIGGVAPESPFGIWPWLKANSMADAFAASAIKSAPVAEWRLHVGLAGLFLNVGGPALLHCSGPLLGCCFEHVVPERLVPSDHFEQVAAGGFCGLANDSLFLWAPHGELFAYSLRARVLSPLPFPRASNLQTIWATRDWLLVLDRDGMVHARAIGFEASRRQETTEWIRFGQPAKFVSIAASAVSLWAITVDSSAIWACKFRPSEGFDRLDWLQIDGPPPVGKQKPPDQVRVSPTGESVWLFSSSSGLAWSRSDLCARNWRGRQWIQVPESLRISDLAVGQNVAWALSKSDGQLHRMQQLGKNHQQNGVERWHPMGFRLNAISVDSMEERLWAVDTEFRLVRQELDIFPRSRLSHTEDGPNHDQLLLEKAQEMPERTLSGCSSAISWCDLGMKKY